MSTGRFTPPTPSVASAPWPRTVFRTAVLRGLDARGREELQQVGRLLDLEAGQSLYEPGEPSDALYVVVRGTLELWATPRGDEGASMLRRAEKDATVGEEAVVPGLRRWARAVAATAVRLVEVPASVLTRALTRGGETGLLEREVRALRRELTRELLLAQAFSRYLNPTDVDLLLDAVSYRTYRSGEFVQHQGAPVENCLLLQKGLVQIQSERDGRVRVHGYLSAGDFFGDQELLPGDQHAYSVVSMGDTVCIHADVDVMRSLCDRNAGLARRLRRMSVGRQATGTVAASVVGSTQHVLKDAYRMQMARSMLAIDQSTCVRCGHCAWACASTHGGVSRLIRSGDKVLVTGQEGLSNLLLPNTCQHCEHPACMIDCPTGALGRDPEGEVFIREELCTGCGACAKACPWDNIQIGVRAETSGGDAVGLSELVAVKCDLCREYEAPACVRACPTDAVQRLDPTQEFADVRALFGRGATATKAGARERALRGRVRALGAGLGVVVLLAGLSLVPTVRQLGRTWIVAAGVFAALGLLLLSGHVVVKRAVRYWLERRPPRGLRGAAAGARGSVVSPWVRVHQSVGMTTCMLVAWHAGFAGASGLSGALLATFVVAALTGAFGSIGYRLIPRRLSRLEWRGSLPEELAGERERLRERLYRVTSGQDPLLKRVAEVILVPYSRSVWQSLALLASGRDLTAERKRLRQHIDERLEGRGGERLAALDEAIKTVVDLRALPIRRVLTALLRGWQPIHAGLTLTLLVLLAIHVVARWGG